MATLIGSALTELATALTAAGIPAAVDARNLVLPGAWLGPGPIDFDRLDADTYSLDVDVYLIAPDHGATAALDLLGDLLDKLRTFTPVGQATPATVNLANHAPGGLPALLVTIPLEVTP